MGSPPRKPEPPPVRSVCEVLPGSVRALMAAIRPVRPVSAWSGVSRLVLPVAATPTPVGTLTVRLVRLVGCPVCGSTRVSRTTGTSARSGLAVVPSSTRPASVAAMVTVSMRLPSDATVTPVSTVAPSMVCFGGVTGSVAVAFRAAAVTGPAALPAGSVRPRVSVRAPSARPDRSRPPTRVVPVVVVPLPEIWPPPAEVMVQVKLSPASRLVRRKAASVCSPAPMSASSNRTVAEGLWCR